MFAPEIGMPTYQPAMLPVNGMAVPKAPWTALVVAVVVDGVMPRAASP